jgi:hypothetical protein
LPFCLYCCCCCLCLQEHAHAQAGEVEFQDERLAASNEREKFEGMWESVMDDPELCEMVAALQARP